MEVTEEVKTEDTSHIEKYKMRVPLSADDILGIWNCLRINVEADITDNEEEDFLLMDIMVFLAHYHKPGTKRKISVPMTFKYYRACWMAINHVIESELMPEDKQQPLLEVMELLAKELDKIKTLASGLANFKK